MQWNYTVYILINHIKDEHYQSEAQLANTEDIDIAISKASVLGLLFKSELPQVQAPLC